MLRLTTHRKKVYDILNNTNKPLSCEMIYEKVEKENINLSTIYRAIDYFFENDLVLKFHFNNKSYYILNQDHNHSHYFICTNCLKMDKIKCNMKDIITDLKETKNYQILNHEMTVYGLCDLCSN